MKSKAQEQIINSFALLNRKLNIRGVISIIFILYLFAFFLFQYSYFEYWGEGNKDSLFSFFLVSTIAIVWISSLSKSIDNLLDILLGIINEQKVSFSKIIETTEREAPQLEKAISYLKRKVDIRS